MRNIKTLFHSSFSGGGGNKMYGRKKNARERLDLSQLQNTTTVSTMVTLEDLENNQQQEENVIDQEILNSSTSI